MGLFRRLIDRSFKRERWTIPFEGAATPPGYRPKGWEFPLKGSGDSDIILVRGEPDGSHTITRFPESPSGTKERRG